MTEAGAYTLMNNANGRNASYLRRDHHIDRCPAASLAKESKEEKVDVRNFFLIKHVKENHGELSVVGTFVQSLFDLNYNTEKSIKELSEEIFFDYRINDLTADHHNEKVTTRRVELSKGTAKKTLQVNAPLDVTTQYDRFPCKIVRATVTIELSSSAWADQRRRPTLLLHRYDKGENIALQLPLTGNTKGINEKEVEEMLTKKMDQSLTYDLITPYPEVSYLYNRDKNYCPKFKVSFYMTESGISKFIQIVFPMLLIATLNTIHVYTEEVDSPVYLANASTFALTAVFILPYIITKRKICVFFCLNNFYIMSIFIGLSLSSIPSSEFDTDIPAKTGMILLWLSFLFPIYGCIRYFSYKCDIRKKVQNNNDRIPSSKIAPNNNYCIPSSKGTGRTDLVTVNDIAEKTVTGELIEYKCNDLGKFIEVYA